ncbi:MAG: hypothetical protein R2818_07750 [Flavobacteriales bacterium]
MRGGQQSALNTLKKEEGRLRDTQRKQESQRKELDAAIRKAIEKGTEAQAETRCQPNKQQWQTGPHTLTPEGKELNADFEKNKGKLPWPVEKGVM